MVAANLADVSVGLNENELVFAKQYLDHFEYHKLSRDIEQQIVNFQEMFGLEPDGILGPKTLHAMVVTPRCGLPDAQMNRDGVNKWGIKRLTFAWVGPIIHQNQDEIFQRALNNWSEVCDLTFVRMKDAANANIVMTGGNNRRDGLGTPGNVLAYAYLPNTPNFQGQLKQVYDTAETFKDQDEVRAGIGFEEVISHETGHTIGLDHSTKQGALMAAYYRDGLKKPQAVDDIPRGVGLYGVPATVPPPIPPTTPGDGLSEITIYKTAAGKFGVKGYRLTKLAG